MHSEKVQRSQIQLGTLRGSAL